MIISDANRMSRLDCEELIAATHCSMPDAIGIHGHCYVLSDGIHTCSDACGGAGRVDVHATIHTSTSSSVVWCLERLMGLENSHDIFDQIDTPCQGTHLLIEGLERWHCYPQFTPFNFPPGFRAPC
eukprot:scaffold16943_cov26-Tisochrysis_lutea.AAC.1